MINVRVVATAVVLASTMAISGMAGGVSRQAAGKSPTTGAQIGDLSAGTWVGGDAYAVARSTRPTNATVTLLTGDRVHLTATDGRQSATVRPAKGSDVGPATFLRFVVDHDLYVVPSRAVPYLAETLDLQLFNVSYLARAGLGDGRNAALPVTIEGRNVDDLPAVHVRARSGNQVRAVVDKAHAQRLGRLLARQWRASLRAGSEIPTGWIPGISRISLTPGPDAPRPPAASSSLPPAASSQPTADLADPRRTAGDQPFHTLTLDLTDRNGNPGSGWVLIQNVGADDPNPGLSVISGVVSGGSGTISVPAGTYSIVSVITSPRPTAPEFDTALTAEPQVTVDSDETVTLDARAAVPYEASLDLPTDSPAFRQDMLTFIRTGETGDRLPVTGANLLVLGLLSVSPNPAPGLLPSGLFAAPTDEIAIGAFGFNASSLFTDKILGGGVVLDEPSYRLSFPSENHIPDSLAYAVPEADLTAVRQEFYAESGTATTRVASILGNDLTVGFGVRRGPRTDYWYSSDPDLEVWEASFTDAADGIVRTGARHVIGAGQVLHEAWEKSPFVPSPAAPPADWLHQTAGDDFTLLARPDPRRTVCAACRQDDIGMVYLAPLGDSDPAHYSLHRMNIVGYPGNSARSGFRFYRNGTLAVDSTPTPAQPSSVPFRQPLPLLPGPAVYRLDWTATDVDDPSASNRTVWTFHSGPDDPPAEIDGQWCAPDITRPCSFLPLLFVNYDLPLDYESRAPAAAPFEIRFTASHQENQPPPGDVRATVTTSFDDGQTWSEPRPAVVGDDGTLSVTVNHPPLERTSGYVSLQVVAQDGVGNVVEQTIIRAYGLSG